MKNHYWRSDITFYSFLNEDSDLLFSENKGRDFILGTLGEDRARQLLGQVVDVGAANTLESLELVDTRTLANFLINEHPQTIALIIAHLTTERKVEVLRKLPEGLQNKKFIEEKKTLFAAEVGRIAPDFSWKENGKNFKLSTLNEAKNYVLVFWSTGCSHCLKEIPKLHTFLQNKKDIKVVAFSLEKEAYGWESMKATLPNWHHVLGLNKWQNKVARTYNIMATPTYLVLDANKKIIAKPQKLLDLKEFLEKL